MKALLFLIRRNLLNGIKSAFKKPLVLIGYIFILLFIIAFIVASFAMPSGEIRTLPPALFRGIMMLVFTVLYYTSLKLGIEKGSSYFRMSDVNMAFTAPLRPNQILLYGFIKQLGGTLFFILLAFFQIPNLKNNFAFEPHGVIVLLLAVVAYTMAYPLIGMLIYSWTSVSKERKRLAKRIFDGAALAVVLIFLIDLSQTRDFVKSMSHVFDHPVAHYFPIIGWTGSIASAAVAEPDTAFLVGAAGMAVVIFGLSLLLYRMKLDYYEDVLEATEYVEAALKAKREGRNMTFGQKTRKNVRGGLSGEGARALFAKNMMEIRKTSMFLFLDRMSVSVILSSILFKLIMPSESGLDRFSMFMVLAFSLYMLLLMQAQGRWSVEVEKPYIFLIPASSYEKLFYASLSEHVKNLFDGALLFTLSGIFFGAQFPTVLACILSYAFFGAVFLYAEVLTRRMFGRVHSKGLMIFIKMIFSFLLVVPGIIGSVIAVIATDSEFYMIGAMGAWAFVLAVTLFMFSAGIFNNIESAS